MARQTNVVSHWYQLIENFETSSLAFYAAVEEGIKTRGVPGYISSRTEFREAGLMTARREYLRIVRGKHTFDICAAPFGSGFFFSWWLVEQTSSFGVLYLLAFLAASCLLFAFLLAVVGNIAGIAMGLIFSCLGVPGIWWLVGNVARDNPAFVDIILVTPILGGLYQRIFDPPTYYVMDTALMFQQAVHNAVIEVVDQVTTARGLRALSEFQRKPVLKAFVQTT